MAVLDRFIGVMFQQSATALRLQSGQAVVQWASKDLALRVGPGNQRGGLVNTSWSDLNAVSSIQRKGCPGRK